MRGAHNGTDAIPTEQTSDCKVGPGLYLLRGTNVTAEGCKFDRRKAMPIATSTNAPDREADSLALGGAITSAARVRDNGSSLLTRMTMPMFFSWLGPVFSGNVPASNACHNDSVEGGE